jgi:hypothetical protein
MRMIVGQGQKDRERGQQTGEKGATDGPRGLEMGEKRPEDRNTEDRKEEVVDRNKDGEIYIRYSRKQMEVHRQMRQERGRQPPSRLGPKGGGEASAGCEGGAV